MPNTAMSGFRLLHFVPPNYRPAIIYAKYGS